MPPYIYILVPINVAECPSLAAGAFPVEFSVDHSLELENCEFFINFDGFILNIEHLEVVIAFNVHFTPSEYDNVVSKDDCAVSSSSTWSCGIWCDYCP